MAMLFGRLDKMCIKTPSALSGYSFCHTDFFQIAFFLLHTNSEERQWFVIL